MSKVDDRSQLIELADSLDSLGHRAEADLLDNFQVTAIREDPGNWRWYVLRCFPGDEAKVMGSVVSIIKKAQKGYLIDVLSIPAAIMPWIRGGERKGKRYKFWLGKIYMRAKLTKELLSELLYPRVVWELNDELTLRLKQELASVYFPEYRLPISHKEMDNVFELQRQEQKMLLKRLKLDRQKKEDDRLSKKVFKQKDLVRRVDIDEKGLYIIEKVDKDRQEATIIGPSPEKNKHVVSLEFLLLASDKWYPSRSDTIGTMSSIMQKMADIADRLDGRGNFSIANKIDSTIQAIASETFPCPNCGAKVLKKTQYCVRCKQKVSFVDDSDTKDDETEQKKDNEQQ